MFLTVIYTGKVSADVIDFTSVVRVMTTDFKHIFILFFLSYTSLSREVS